MIGKFKLQMSGLPKWFALRGGRIPNFRGFSKRIYLSFLAKVDENTRTNKRLKINIYLQAVLR